MANPKSCIVLKNESRYDVLRYFSDLIAQGFEKAGLECLVFDSVKENAIHEYVELCKSGQYDFVFSFNGSNTLDFRMTDGESFLDECGLASVNFMVDNPSYHFRRLILKNDLAKYSFIDREHCLYFEKFYGKKSAFIPHGGCRGTEKIDFEKKNGEMLFLGSIEGVDNPYVAMIDKLPEFEQGVFMDIVDLMAANPGKSYFDALIEILEYKKIEMSDKEVTELSAKCVGADMFIRNSRRIETLVALAKLGLPMTLYGVYGAIKPELERYKNCTIKKECTFKYAISRIARTKIVLNAMAGNTHGTHERIFTAMLAGTVCATNKNAYLEELFTDNENVVFFEFGDYKKLCDRISDLFTNEELYNKIASAAMVVAENFTWDSAARKVLDMF
jgi:glycosyltransferase involved in cell wall biosynthesis